MDSLIWKMKQWFRKILPLAIIGALLYGGYSLYHKGTFRHGVVPGIRSILARLPVFGSHFRRHTYGGEYTRSHGHRSHRSHHRRHRRR